jgi:hypothetical protein
LLVATALLVTALLLGGCGTASGTATMTAPKSSQKASVGAGKDTPTQVPLSSERNGKGN